MTDQLAVIDKVIAEHAYIRRGIKLVGDSTSDLEALFSLQQTQHGWVMSALENLATKRQSLQQALAQVDAGIKKHFSYEEKALPLIFGETLMKVLMFEHNAISQQLTVTQKMVNETKLEEMEEKDLLSIRYRLQQIVSNLCQDIELHAMIEEQILRWLKKNFELKLAQAKQL